VPSEPAKASVRFADEVQAAAEPPMPVKTPEVPRRSSARVALPKEQHASEPREQELPVMQMPWLQRKPRLVRQAIVQVREVHEEEGLSRSSTRLRHTPHGVANLRTLTSTERPFVAVDDDEARKRVAKAERRARDAISAKALEAGFVLEDPDVAA
jgi:hypothetical protein